MGKKQNNKPGFDKGSEIPIGLGFAFAQNFNALTAFASLDDSGKHEVIAKASGAKSREEMRELAESLILKGEKTDNQR